MLLSGNLFGFIQTIKQISPFYIANDEGIKKNLSPITDDPDIISEQPNDETQQILTHNNSASQQTDSKLKFFMKWIGLDLLATASGMSISLALALNKINVSNYFPVEFAKFIKIHNNFHFPLNSYFKVGVIAPIMEEIECRFLIQEIALKQMPKKILSKISPKYVSLVDSKIAKITRVFISSFLFALPHYLTQESLGGLGGNPILKNLMGNRIIVSFAGGIVLGSLQEATGSIANSLIVHAIHNCVVRAVSGNG
jgi:membrane protease YdiL (CAAX protease family)